eukprot:226997-Lingulodinium_polyedra.AAC.1
MASSPFGPGAVDAGGRYLGAWLAAAAYGALTEGTRWTSAALQSVAFGTWQKFADEVGERATRLTLRPSSLA